MGNKRACPLKFGTMLGYKMLVFANFQVLVFRDLTLHETSLNEVSKKSDLQRPPFFRTILVFVPTLK